MALRILIFVIFAMVVGRLLYVVVFEIIRRFKLKENSNVPISDS